MKMFVYEEGLAPTKKFLSLRKMNSQLKSTMMQLVIDKIIYETGFNRWVLPLDRGVVSTVGHTFRIMCNSIEIAHKTIRIRMSNCLYLRNVKNMDEYEQFYQDFINMVEGIVCMLFKDDLSELFKNARERMKDEVRKHRVAERVLKSIDNDAFLLVDQDYDEFIYYLPMFNSNVQLNEGDDGDLLLGPSTYPDSEEIADMFINIDKLKESDVDYVKAFIGSADLRKQFMSNEEKINKIAKSIMDNDFELIPSSSEKINYKEIAYLGIVSDQNDYNVFMFRTKNGYFVAADYENKIYLGKTLEDAMERWTEYNN